jgi:putative membrane protein
MHRICLVMAMAALGAVIAYPQTSQRSSAGAAAMSDQQFLKNAAQGGMAEVELGQLAEKNASSSTVKQFGQRMVTDHSRLNEQTKAVAAQKNVTLPTSMNSEDQAEYRDLSSKTGSDFDKAYIRDMLKDHNKDIEEFRHEANAGNDPDIKALAAKALPVLEEHLRLAENAAKQLGISTSPTGGDLR